MRFLVTMWLRFVLAALLAAQMDAFDYRWSGEKLSGTLKSSKDSLASLVVRTPAGSGEHLEAPQTLESRRPDDTWPYVIPHFTMRLDGTLTWDEMGWCVEASGKKNGDAVRVNHCTGRPEQRWLLSRKDRIQLRNTEQCLNVNAPTSSHGAPAELHDCDDELASEWRFVPERGHSKSHDRSSSVRRVMRSFMLLGVAIPFIALGVMWQWRRRARIVCVFTDCGGVSLTMPSAIQPRCEFVIPRFGELEQSMTPAAMLLNPALVEDDASIRPRGISTADINVRNHLSMSIGDETLPKSSVESSDDSTAPVPIDDSPSFADADSRSEEAAYPDLGPYDGPRDSSKSSRDNKFSDEQTSTADDGMVAAFQKAVEDRGIRVNDEGQATQGGSFRFGGAAAASRNASPSEDTLGIAGTPVGRLFGVEQSSGRRDSNPLSPGIPVSDEQWTDELQSATLRQMVFAFDNVREEDVIALLSGLVTAASKGNSEAERSLKKISFLTRQLENLEQVFRGGNYDEFQLDSELRTLRSQLRMWGKDGEKYIEGSWLNFLDKLCNRI